MTSSILENIIVDGEDLNAGLDFQVFLEAYIAYAEASARDRAQALLRAMLQISKEEYESGDPVSKEDVARALAGCNRDGALVRDTIAMIICCVSHRDWMWVFSKPAKCRGLATVATKFACY